MPLRGSDLAHARPLVLAVKLLKGIRVFDFDNQKYFMKVLDIQVPWAHTWADMRPGKTDRERRENYRREADGRLVAMLETPLWWAFKIFVCKSGRQLDVDNVLKPIVDSFCTRQIVKDKSNFTDLGLYPDDTLKHVRILQVAGAPSETEDTTRIQIYACIREVQW